MKKLLGCYDPSWNDYKMNLSTPSNIFKNFSKRSSKYLNNSNAKIINNSIRICIECGSYTVLINKNNLYCNNCNAQFKIREEKNGCLM